MRSAISIFIAALLFPAVALAGEIEVTKAWARATIGAGDNGAVYVTVVNRGTAPDRLLASETPVSRKAALHGHKMDDEGVMRMRPVEALEIAPGATVTLKPGHLHIMLMGLALPLREGDEFELTLRFEKAGAMTVAVPVGPPAAQGPSED